MSNPEKKQKRVSTPKKMEMHLCVSCGHLISIHRKKIRVEYGEVPKYRYVSSCGPSKYPKNPWNFHKCPWYITNPNQKTLLDYITARIHAEKEEKEKEG